MPAVGWGLGGCLPRSLSGKKERGEAGAPGALPAPAVQAQPLWGTGGQRQRA